MMRKKVIYIGKQILIFTVLFCGAIGYNSLSIIQWQLNACETVEACDAEASRISEEKQQLKEQLANNQAQQKDLNEQIFLLIDQIKLADDELANLQDSITQLEKEILRLETVIKEKEKDVKELLVQQQKETNANIYLSMMLSAHSISDFMIKMNAVEMINGAKQTYITELQNDRDKLTESKQKLEENKQQVEANKKEKQDLMEQHQNTLDELHRLEASVHGELADLELTEDEIFQQRAILAGGVPSANGWFLPAQTGSLTCAIGCYADHIGTDFGMRVGTPIYAIANGTVVYTQYSTSSVGFGTMVLLAHNINGVPHISIYGHMSALQVSPGDVVRGGQQIGLSGNTGASTGPHLHLEIVHSTNEYVGKDFRRSHLVNALNVLPKPSGGWYW